MQFLLLDSEQMAPTALAPQRPSQLPPCWGGQGQLAESVLGQSLGDAVMFIHSLTQPIFMKPR